MAKSLAAKNTSVYTYTNNNPLRYRSGDCVIRAISLAFDMDWYEVYDDLYRLGREMADMPNVNTVYSTYIRKKGGEQISAYRELEGGRKRLTARDLAKRNGTFIISTAKHLAVVKDKKLLDTWDSSDRSAYKVWEIA